MTYSFQIDTEKLQAIIDLFNTQATHAAALNARFAQHLEALRRTAWQGPEAARIFARVENDLLPRIVKLQTGLGAASDALGQFLERMVDIAPALDHLNNGLPRIEAAREKIEAHIEKLQNQNPEEMKRALQKILREQGHDDAADQLDHIAF